MNALLVIYLIVYYIVGFLFGLELLHIIQLKEYRLDRLRDFITSSKGKKQLLLHPVFIISLLFTGITAITGENYFKYYIGILSIFWLYRLIKRKIFRPVVTKKSFILIVLLLIGVLLTGVFQGIVLLYLIPQGPWSIPLFILVHALYFPIWTLFWSQLFQIPTYFVKKNYIRKATKKLSTYSNLKVVGITGSYGKTSTKNFLVEILKNKYTVATTPKNINTEIGIAQFILDHDFSSDEVFVVEMGAYCKGEIKLIADMVQPLIGIVTAIGPEHLALFGSIEKIRDTKGELFDALPSNGLAITNADNPYCREILKSVKARSVTFGSSDVHHPTLLIHNKEQTVDGISGIFDIAGEQVEVTSSLYGMHNLNNFAAAHLAAIHVGVEIEDITDTLQSLSAPPHRLARKEKPNNTVVLDDTYNANPEGFIEALDVLKLQSQAIKVVITRGMLELGRVSKEEHVRIGKKIGAIASQLIIISPDNAKELEQGAKSVNPSIKVHAMYDMKEVTNAYHAIIGQGNVAILLENRVPQNILDI